jgi:large subunit ribosomal protein L31
MSGVAFLSLSLGAAQLFQLPQAPLSSSSARPVAQPLALSPAQALATTYWEAAAGDVAEEYPRAPASASLVAVGVAAVGLAATVLTRKAKPMVFLAVGGGTKHEERKAALHPEWYPNAQVYCDGQLIMKIGSTKPKLDVDLWSGNHPFYTGSQKIMDTEGRVERFMRKYGLKAEDQNLATE